MSHHLKTMLAAACMAAAFCTGCGDHANNQTANRGTETSVTSQTTTRFTDIAPDTTEPTVTTTDTTSTTWYSSTATTETSKNLLDHAEDALDSAEEAVTSILTKLTSEIHNHNMTVTTSR